MNTIVEDGEVLKLDWLTRILALPYGREKFTFYEDYESTHRKYILLAIEKGEINVLKVVRQKEYLQFLKKQFEVLKKTEVYKDLIKEIKTNYDFDELSAEYFVQEHILEYVSSW